MQQICAMHSQLGQVEHDRHGAEPVWAHGETARLSDSSLRLKAQEESTQRACTGMTTDRIRCTTPAKQLLGGLDMLTQLIPINKARERDAVTARDVVHDDCYGWCITSRLSRLSWSSSACSSTSSFFR